MVGNRHCSGSTGERRRCFNRGTWCGSGKVPGCFDTMCHKKCCLLPPLWDCEGWINCLLTDTAALLSVRLFCDNKLPCCTTPQPLLTRSPLQSGNLGYWLIGKMVVLHKGLRKPTSCRERSQGVLTYVRLEWSVLFFRKEKKTQYIHGEMNDSATQSSFDLSVILYSDTCPQTSSNGKLGKRVSSCSRTFWW